MTSPIYHCPACGTENPGDARSCGTCGKPLSGMPQAERRGRFRLYAAIAVVVALLAGFVGYMVISPLATGTVPTRAPAATSPPAPAPAPAATAAPDPVAAPARTCDPEVIKIGALYPLTGGAAAIGEKVLHGVQLAAEIVNGEYPELTLPLAAEAGLPNLCNSTIEIIQGDHQGDAEIGANETERLITSEGVAAMVGAYYSSVSQKASERAERLGVPFVNGSSLSSALTARGLEFFYRTGPHDRTLSQNLFDFLVDLKALGHDISTIGILTVDIEYGANAAKAAEEDAIVYGFEVTLEVQHGNEVDDVVTEATKIAEEDPDAILQVSYLGEAILFNKAWVDLDYAPGILALGAGYSNEEFYDAVGVNGDFVIVHSVWALGAVQNDANGLAVAQLMEDQFGHAMDENSARSFTAALTLFYAMNEAGTTDPTAVRDAVKAVDLSTDQTIMPWGVKFGPDGQNIHARGVIVQRIDGTFKVIWPFEVAEAEVVWPIPAYSER